MPSFQTYKLAHDYLQDFIKNFMELLEQKRYVQSLDYAFNETFGKSFYLPYLRHVQESNLLERNILGNKMFLDIDDPGLSYELLIHGEREKLIGEAFRNKLKELREEKSNPTIIEAGANIGYYALQEARILNGRGKIFAFEPVPNNVRLLRKNLQLNQFDDMVTIEQCAIGDEPGSAEMVVEKASNWGRISTDDNEKRRTIEVEKQTLDNYLDIKGHPKDEIDFVRMDVEGYEVNVLKGMEDIMSSNKSLSLFIEIHTGHLRETKQMDTFIKLLNRYNFEPEFAVRRRRVLDLESVEDLNQLSGAPNLLLRKG